MRTKDTKFSIILSFLLLFSLCFILSFISTDKRSIIVFKNSCNAPLTRIADKDTVSVKDFGAKGDGIHDDTLAIQNAINSGFSNIIFDFGKYKITDYIMIHTDNITLHGNNSILFTDNDYRHKDNFFEWVVNIRADNVTLNDLTIKACETVKVGYKTQLGVQNASGIHIDHCNFIIPSTVLSHAADRNLEYTNVDLYTNWHNVTIENSLFENYADCEAGSCIMARDVLSQPSGGLNFRKNRCYKISHDEIIFISGKNGSVENVKISNNIISADEKSASSSDISISLGTADAKKTNQIIFEKNTVKCKSAYAFITFGNSTNVTVRNNNITFTKSSFGKGSVVFTQGESTDQIKVNNNHITLKSNSPSGIGTFSDAKASYYNNTIFCDCIISDSLFSTRTITAQRNKITAQRGLGMIGNNLSDFRYNNIILNNYSRIFFQYYNHVLTKNVNIIGNTIKYNNSTFAKTPTTLLMINFSALNNHPIKIESNDFQVQNTSAKSALYYLSLTDKNPQSIILKNNAFHSFHNTYSTSKISHNITVN